MEHFGLKNLNELPNASELRSLALPSAKISAEAQFKNPADAHATAESPESNAADIREPEAETEAKIAVTPDPSDHQHDSTERG
jgi:hypothetical protein